MMYRRDPASVPALSQRHVRRPRLTRVLDEAAGQAVVLTAPAGYGKTALAAEWLADRTAAWYRASPAAADLAAFSVGLAEAAQAVVPGAGERVRQRARVEEAPERAVRPLAEVFAEGVAAWPDDAWLAVDDYHVVAESDAVEEFVDWVLALSPVRLFVTARRRPRWVTARRVLYGEITELTRDELAMTREEARRVLEGRSGEAVAALVEQAQGWPALIGLAGLSASFALPTARISEALFRYFAEEVLRSEPADVQRFMLAASVPLAIDARTASELTGVPDGEPAIARLEEKGLLHPAGNEARRFHPLLRDFLRARLAETDPEEAASLGARALAEARAARRWDEAFELAVEHRRLDAAAEVLADAAPELLAVGRVETIERWLAECGEGALARPAVVVARAEVLIRRGRLFEALELAEALARRLPSDDSHASAAWYLAGRGFHLLSRDEEALACHLRACETAKTRSDRVNALWGATVLAAQLESDVIHRLVAELEDVASDDVDARLQLASGRAFLASSSGSLAGVWSTFEPLLHLADEASDPMAVNSFLIAAAYLSASRADYALANELANRAISLCEQFRLGPMKLAFSLCQRAAAEIGLRRFPDAARTLGALDGLDIGHTRILVWERTNLELKLLLGRGRLAEICDASRPPADGSGTRSSVGEHAGVVALAAAAAGDAERAHAEARRARETTRSVEAAFYARFAELVLAVGDGRAEVPAALSEAVEAEMDDAFVLAYRAYPPLLASAAADTGASQRAAAIVARANDHALARKTGLAMPERDGRAAAVGELTPRESEVLRLMAEGLGNAEISRRLVISEKTTKVHIHHIFQKLGVTTRVQAVLASRRLFEPVDRYY